MSTTRNARPINWSTFRTLRKRWHEAENEILTHVVAGSQSQGLENSFMSRVKLTALRNNIDMILSDGTREEINPVPTPAAPADSRSPDTQSCDPPSAPPSDAPSEACSASYPE